MSAAGRPTRASSRVVVATALAAAAALRCACAGAVMAGAAPDSPAARVDPNRASSPWAGVGSVTVDGAPFSGVAIGRRQVLTAAHVVAGAEASRVRFRVNATDTPLEMRVASIVVHPGFVGFATPNLNDDLAVVVLAADLPPSVPIYAIDRASRPAGTVFTVVGYGGSGQGDGSGRVGADPGVKRTGRNAADRFVPDDEGSGALEVFQFDFDGGGKPNLLGGPSLGNAIESSLASGDSGAPAFVTGTSPPVVYGIVTYLASFQGGPTDPGTFGTGGGGQLVAAYAGWIDATVLATAAADDPSGDAPLPAWATLLMATGLATSLRRRRGAAAR